MRVFVDLDACIGCGACAEICPAVFEMTDDDKVAVRTDPVPAAEENACREAVEQCPVEAISVQK